ncbi:zinc finger and BTB domain-containing protein 7A-like isoform X1 [Macrobrachium rosenbergii]|uniref:zinc finger and BTB domain-containing protein 7A-like isoform X1 n=1 Tax=Macrobrachium rosenbergii TaxID=79674 RepID=UPI0034D4C0CB
MADGMLALSWNNHSTTFSHMLSQIRQKDRYTDATVACEGKFYHVHRIVLSTCSTYFEEMFELASAGKHPIVLLQDVRKYELEALLSYMYAGVVSVAQKDLSRLIKIAELLQIKGLAVPDELPSEKKISTSNQSERTGSGHHKSSHLLDTSDGRTSPSRKRRRREERRSSPHSHPSTSSSSRTQYNQDDDDDIQEIKDDLERQQEQLGLAPMSDSNHSVPSVEGTRPIIPSDSGPSEQQQLPQEPPRKSGKDGNDELVWVKEEVLDDPGEPGADPIKTELPSYGTVGPGGDESVDLPSDGQEDYSQTSHSQMPPPLSEPVAEALAGPSGIHEWLSGGDMSAGLPAVDNYGGEGSPPTSDHPQSQQMEGLSRSATEQPGWRVIQGGIPSSSQIPQKASPYSAASKIPFQLGFQDESASDISKLSKLMCPYCPAMFTRRNHVVQHMRTHTGEKPYGCPQCPAAFAQKGNLIVHMRTHTGEKPFWCPFCEAKFARKSSRDTHIASSHAKETSAALQ